MAVTESTPVRASDSTMGTQRVAVSGLDRIRNASCLNLSVRPAESCAAAGGIGELSKSSVPIWLPMSRCN